MSLPIHVLLTLLFCLPPTLILKIDCIILSLNNLKLEYFSKCCIKTSTSNIILNLFVHVKRETKECGTTHSGGELCVRLRESIQLLAKIFCENLFDLCVLHLLLGESIRILLPTLLQRIFVRLNSLILDEILHLTLTLQERIANFRSFRTSASIMLKSYICCSIGLRMLIKYFGGLGKL